VSPAEIQFTSIQRFAREHLKRNRFCCVACLLGVYIFTSRVTQPRFESAYYSAPSPPGRDAHDEINKALSSSVIEHQMETGNGNKRSYLQSENKNSTTALFDFALSTLYLIAIPPISALLVI
jgi:hypothetical protein